MCVYIDVCSGGAAAFSGSGDVSECGSEDGGAVPDFVLSAGAFVNSRYGNAVVLDPESSAGSAEWDSGIVRDQRKGLLYDSKLAMFSIVLMSLWAGFGGNMMIFLAGLKGIPPIYYEAAKIEGASKWQMFTKITMPSITKTTFLVSTMLIIGTFQVFDQAFVLTKGGPGNATITIVYYIYNNGFKNLDMGYASSISLVLFAIILVMTVINSKINKADI